ncbi:MAG: MMPL family transporter [Solirubrobacterales bacterium]
MFNALAGLAQRRGRIIVIAAFVGAVAGGVIGGGVADHLDPYGADDPKTESIRADKRIEAAGFREVGLLVLVEDANVKQAATRARIEKIEQRLSSSPDVARVSSFYDTGSPNFVARKNDSTYLAVNLEATDDRGQQDAAERIAGDLEGQSGIKVGGYALAQQQVNDQVEHDLKMAEMLAFPLLFLLSLLFFRSLVAAGLPLLVGGLAIVGTFLGLRIASEFGSISIFALNLTTGLGLGLAIDYSLFIVSRYREEIARDGPGLTAMRRTMATAGRTVLFSSLTVAAALASLLVFPQRFLYSMGLGGAMVALLAAAISLIVLPAILALLGHRVNSLAPKFLQRRAERDASPTTEGFWYRLSRFVQRFPGRIAIATAAFLIFLGIPFYAIKFTWVDAQVLPTSASARQVDDVIRADYPPFRDTPVRILVDGGGPRVAAKVQRQVSELPGVAEMLPPQPLQGGATLVQAVSKNSYLDEPTQTLVSEISALPAPPGSEVAVTGFAARFLDFQDSLKRHLPAAVSIVVLATLVILFLMTGSVILPIKALLMNVLNLSAVFGILVFIFQDGRLQGLLSYTSQGALEQTMPILLFAVAFGLSTDYGVFLLSRIKEARDNGATDTDSVAIGLERTGRIVTAAAMLFAIAIGAFATSQIIFIKENGVGTALAVLIDATIIRALLVPSLMELLGHWNWWAPKPLRWLHFRIGLDERETIPAG